MATLVFEVSSTLAMFRKGYTTTSAVSYPFIPPTAVAGVIAAIVGIDNGANVEPDRADYWNHFSGTQIAIRIQSRLRWYSTAVNLIMFKTKNGDMGEHIQPKHQFVHYPSYRIYVRGGGLYKDLKARLSCNEFIFTPYLGVAYAVAEVVYIGEFEEEEISQLPVAIQSVVPAVDGVIIDISKSLAIFKERVPVAQDVKRNFIRSLPVLYSGQQSLGALYVKEKGVLSLTKVGRDAVAWFNAW